MKEYEKSLKNLINLKKDFENNLKKRDRDCDQLYIVHRKEFNEKIQAIENRLKSIDNFTIQCAEDRFKSVQHFIMNTDMLKNKLEDIIEHQKKIRNNIFKNTKVVLAFFLLFFFNTIFCLIILCKFFK